MSKVQNWIRGVIASADNLCIFWPFAKCPNGYGKLRYQSKYWLAHRFICAMVHGEPPDGALALHSCGRGEHGCVNPNHLRWGTAKENTGDALSGGTFPVGERA